MLFESNMEQLRKALKTAHTGIKTSAVASVLSPVMSISEEYPSANHDKFEEAMVDTFIEGYDLDRNTLDVHKVGDKHDVLRLGQRSSEAERLPNWGDTSKFFDAGEEELHSWDWTFGQTPAFTQRLKCPIELDSAVCYYRLFNSCYSLESPRP